MKLKLKVLQRYKDLIRKPLIEHKNETISNEYLRNLVSNIELVKDMTSDDERQLRSDFE